MDLGLRDPREPKPLSWLAQNGVKVLGRTLYDVAEGSALRGSRQWRAYDATSPLRRRHRRGAQIGLFLGL